MDKDTLIALLAYVLLFILAFILSIGLGLGEAESMHDPSSPLLYLRRVLMVIAAIALPWVTRRQSPSALGWTLSVKWIGIALAVGLVMGFSNPGGFNPKDPLAILLALFHTFATELFFRGYLFKTFEHSAMVFFISPPGQSGRVPPWENWLLWVFSRWWAYPLAMATRNPEAFLFPG
jgi:hypothetical protein